MHIRKRHKNYRSPSIGNLLFMLIGIAAIFLATSTLALAIPPDCSEGETEDDALKACEREQHTEQGLLLDELVLLVDEMENMDGLDTAAITIVSNQTGEENGLREHIEKLKRSHGRADEILDESTNDDFEELVAQGGKQKGQTCDWKETDDVQQNPDNYVPTGLIVPDINNSNLGNGDCDKFQAEDETSGKPITVNERSQPNICARICEDRDIPGQTLAAQGVKKKQKIKDRFIARKSESIDATKGARDAIFEARQEMMSMNIMADRFGAEYAITQTFPECERPADVPHIATWGTKVVLVPVVVGAKIVTRVAEWAKDSTDTISKQDVAGFNASTAALPAIIAHQIFQGIVDVLEGLIDAADLTNEGFEIFSADATHTCVAKIRGEVDDIRTRVINLETTAAGIDDALIRLEKSVDDNQEFILNVREILLTPYGRRGTVELYEAQLEQ